MWEPVAGELLNGSLPNVCVEKEHSIERGADFVLWRGVRFGAGPAIRIPLTVRSHR